MSSPRERAGAALVVGAWLIIAAPIAFGGTLWFRDLLIYSYPQKAYAVERLLGASLPLWCERWGTGRPFFALTQPGIFDPLNVLVALPGALGLDLFNLSHALLMSFGMRAWLRREGVDALDASCAAVLLGASGYVASMLATNGSYAWGVAWVPWCLVAVGAAARAAARWELARATAGVALAVALGVLSGDPLSALFSGACGLALALSVEDPRARRGALLALLVGASLAGVICAVQLLPAAELARTFRPAGVTMRDAETFSLPPLRLVELLVPDALGVPLSAEWEAPARYTRSAQQRIFPLALTLHLGVAVVPLAALAVATRRRLDLALGALAAGALVIAMGRHTPVWLWMFSHVPGVAMFRGPEKAVFVATLALAALAARGLSEARRRPLGSALGAALIAGALGVFAWRGGSAGALRGAAWLCGYALLFALSSRAPRVASWPAALMAFEVTLAALPLYRWAPRAALYAPPPLLRAITRDRGGDPRGALVFRDLLLRARSGELDPMTTVATLMPNHAMRDGIRFLDSYDALRTHRVRSLRRAIAERPALLRAWGVDYVVVREGEAAPPWTRHVATDPLRGVSLRRVEGTAAPLFVARTAQRVSSTGEALDAMSAADFAPGEAIAVEGAPRAARGRCALRRAAAERRWFRCESDAPAWMHVAESFDPRWRARVNGAAVSPVRSNELFTAVPLPGGAAEVELYYDSSGLGAGAALSLAGLALALGLSAGPRGRWLRAPLRRSPRRTRDDETGS